MEKQAEKKVERALVKEVEARGGKCLKLLSNHLNGLPDRIILLPGGRLFFVEVKGTGEKTRRIQDIIHGRLRKLGFCVYVIQHTNEIPNLFL